MKFYRTLRTNQNDQVQLHDFRIMLFGLLTSSTVPHHVFFSRHIRPSSRGEIYSLERTDGSQSDTALGTLGAGGKKRRSSLSARVVAIVGIPSRRSRSTSQLSQTGQTLPANHLHRVFLNSIRLKAQVWAYTVRFFLTIAYGLPAGFKMYKMTKITELLAMKQEEQSDPCCDQCCLQQKHNISLIIFIIRIENMTCMNCVASFLRSSHHWLKSNRHIQYSRLFIVLNLTREQAVLANIYIKKSNTDSVDSDRETLQQ